jgi:uncharacterized protein YoxC
MKLIGNTDVEDALLRLDNLTKEEALMASAEHLKSTHSIDEGVQGIRRRLEDVGNRTQCVHGRVEIVDEGVQEVRDAVRCVDHKVQNVDHNVQGIGNKVDQVNRQHLSTLLSLLLNLIKFSQRTTSEMAFETGYHLRIRPLTTIFCVPLITRGQLNGSLVVKISIFGNLVVPSFGYTENVRCS